MKISPIIFICCFWLLAGQARSAENWYWQSSGQLLLKNYSGSAQSDNLSAFGVFLSGDYLEQAGFTIGYNNNYTNYKSALDSGLQGNDENILFLSGHRNYYPDKLPGTLMLRLDGYVGNDETSFQTATSGPPMGNGFSQQIVTETVKDKFFVVYPTVSFLNYAKTVYADLGYAFSSYHSNDNGTDDIDIVQWTPTVGFGFNRGYDWLQLRAFFISLSASNRVEDKDGTTALEAKWTHWFTANAPLNLHSVRLSLLAGERIYAVDSDACSLCNVADVQTGLVAIGAEWKLSEKTSLLLQSGNEAYESLLLNDDYSSTYIYVYLSQNW